MTSCRTNSKFGFGSRWAMFAFCPVNRLSIHTTSWPPWSSRSQRCEPKKPAPPVTRIRMPRQAGPSPPRFPAKQANGRAREHQRGEYVPSCDTTNFVVGSTENTTHLHPRLLHRDKPNMKLTKNITL